jgi:hypothetical protein
VKIIADPFGFGELSKNGYQRRGYMGGNLDW